MSAICLLVPLISVLLPLSVLGTCEKETCAYLCSCGKVSHGSIAGVTGCMGGAGIIVLGCVVHVWLMALYFWWFGQNSCVFFFGGVSEAFVCFLVAISAKGVAVNLIMLVGLLASVE